MAMMVNELRCLECGSICENVQFEEGGRRSGVCRNPTCKLNQDGIGIVSECRGAVVAMSFPTGGHRLEQLISLTEGKALPEPLPEDVGELDGLAFCGDCGAPIFYDGKRYYRHVQDLPQSRLRKLMRVRRFAEQVYKWIITLRFQSSEHGEQPNPFLWEMDEEEFCGHVATRPGARDLWLLFGGLQRDPNDVNGLEDT